MVGDHVSADAGIGSAAHAQSRGSSPTRSTRSRAGSSTTRRAISSSRTTPGISTDQVERIRNEVVMGALQGLAVRLGSLREGRKSMIFVSEGFTAMLPPQMRRMDASAARESGRVGGRGQSPGLDARDHQRVVRADGRLLAPARCLRRRRTATTRRSIRSTRAGWRCSSSGSTMFRRSPPSFATDRRALQMTQDTLRVALGGDRRPRDRQPQHARCRDSRRWCATRASTTCLATPRRQTGADGKFHQIKVRVKRARRGRPRTEGILGADHRRCREDQAIPTSEVAKPVQTALASIATSVQAGKYVRTWVGTERGRTARRG